MLFNSYEFIFGFLPIAVAGFIVLRGVSRGLTLSWLIVASLFFYAWWRPANLLIIAPAIVVTFGLARLLTALAANPARSRAAKCVLALAIAFNVCLLGYFKYSMFVKSALNDLVGTDFVIAQIILPLGISFIVFQKIAFLIDVHAGRVQSFSFRDFCLFILFFPQLIAGPIVHYRETMPQFASIPRRFDPQQISVGLTLFAIGLFKKVVLADGIALYVTPIYETAAADASVSFFPAWLAAVGFTLQIYFDFSAYSDMATGLARCFGIRLPMNFDSPLKASSIIDFWARWHVTLTKFLTAYLYNPLLLTSTRRRLAKGVGILRGRETTPAAFLHLLAGPTLLTMFVSGLWHGAGFLFILWGLLHGVYLTINHAWRLATTGISLSSAAHRKLARSGAFVLTFLSVAVAMVLFRAPNGTAAIEILQGLGGINGITLPGAIVERLPDAVLTLVTPDGSSATAFAAGYAWTTALLLIALLLPNSLDIMASYAPVLDMGNRPHTRSIVGDSLRWSPTPAWACLISILVTASILRIGGESEFLYWQF